MGITRKQVEEKVSADQVTVSQGVVTVRRGFYYTHGRTADNLVLAVKEAFPGAVILDSGEVWKPFRGGAPIQRQSHWFVKFRVPSAT